MLALIAVYLAAFIDYRPRLAPGEAATVAIIAADRKQARSVMRFMVGMFNAVPLLQAMVGNQTAEILTLTNGVVIEIHTASFRVTRGYSLVAAICDEIAFWRTDDASANTCRGNPARPAPWPEQPAWAAAAGVIALRQARGRFTPRSAATGHRTMAACWCGAARRRR